MPGGVGAWCNNTSAGWGTALVIKVRTLSLVCGSTGVFGRLMYLSRWPAWNSLGVNVTVPSGSIVPSLDSTPMT